MPSLFVGCAICARGPQALSDLNFHIWSLIGDFRRDHTRSHVRRNIRPLSGCRRRGLRQRQRGFWSLAGGRCNREVSQADFAASLPQGLDTPDNYPFEINAGDDGACVGYIWFAVVEKNGLRSAFVYDIEIKPEFRRKGYAEATFNALEPLVLKLGLSSIGLHVFSQNIGAQTSYRKLGYGVTSVNMLKHLVPALA